MFGGNNKGKRAANKKKGYKHEKGNNPYRIEQLGTRLMMDGNQWGDEIQSSVYYAVGSASLGVAA